MAIKMRRLPRAALTALFFSLFAANLQAQVSGYFITSRLVQRLAWADDEYTSRYEAIIEKEEDGVFVEIIREYTQEPSIDVSLSPGRYRYMVIPYDFLDYPGLSSGWMNIEVRAIVDPELDSFSPDFMYLESGETVTLDIYGKNLEPGAEMFVRVLGGQPVYPEQKIIDEDGNHALLFFQSNALVPGDYEIVVRNPGGPETYGAAVTFAVREPLPEPGPRPLRERLQFDGYAAIAWMPLLNLYSAPESSSPSMGLPLAGVAIRLGVTFNVANYIDIGPEITTYLGISNTSSLFTVFFTGYGFPASWELNILAHKPLPDQASALNFRLGAGFGYFMKPDIYVNTGISFYYLFSKNFYAEAGLEYTHFLDHSAGSFRPSIGLGLRI